MASSIRGSTAHLDRVHSKDELQALNNRLAKYIDRIRNLENENVALQKQLSTAEQHTVTEVHRVTKNYDDELSKLRKQLEDVLRDNSRLQMEKNSLDGDNKQLQQRVAQLEKQLQNTEGKLRQAEDGLSDLQHRLAQSLDARQQAESDNKDLKLQINSLRQELQRMKQEFDNERVRSADLENRLHTKEEEFEFEKNALHETLREERSQRQYLLNDLQRGLQDEYDSKLVQRLQELREEYEDMIRNTRAEVEAQKDAEIRNLMSRAERGSEQVIRLQEEVEDFRKRYSSMQEELNRLRKENGDLNTKLAELQRQKDDYIRQLQQEINKLSGELGHVQDDLRDLTRQYQDLLYVKLNLDVELANYNKLLAGEEARLGMDGSSAAGTIKRPTTSTNIYGTSSTSKTAYSSRPTYTYTPIAATPIGGASGAGGTMIGTTSGRYTPVTPIMTRGPSPAASLGRERDIPVIREQKITETFKATSTGGSNSRVGPRTDW